MVKVVNIKPSKNPDFVQVELEQQLSGLDAICGLRKPRKIWALASAKSHTAQVGMTINGNIEVKTTDTPQYEGHKPFEKTGKYYKCVFVPA